MQSSVTSRRARSGLKAVSVNSSAEVSCRAGTDRAASLGATGAKRATTFSGRMGFKFIDGPEIQIAGHQHLDPIPLILGDRRWNVDGVFEHLAHDILGAGGVINDGAATALGGDRALHGAADQRDQNRGPEALKEMPVDVPGKP